MASLERIRIHPIKGLEGVECSRVQLSPVGGLDGDRAYAIRDPTGEYVNGKRTGAVNRLWFDVDLDANTASFGVRGSDDGHQFHLEREREALGSWLSAYFGLEVVVEEAPGGQLTESTVLGGAEPGVTVVSTGTLETVASWFPDLDVESIRRRFRANLEVNDVEPFWEDRLVGDGGQRFRIGDVGFDGINPVPRCVVPTRDPDTGERTEGFRERFIEKREETFPSWIDPDAFEQSNALTVLARPERAGRGETIGVGDTVELRE